MQGFQPSLLRITVEFDVPQRIGYISTSMDDLGIANGAGDQFLNVVRAYQEVHKRSLFLLKVCSDNEDGSSSSQLYPGYSKTAGGATSRGFVRGRPREWNSSAVGKAASLKARLYKWDNGKSEDMFKATLLVVLRP
jgi:hypothetical protein